MSAQTGGEDSREREHLSLVVDAAPIAIVVADQSGRITLVNLQAERLFGYRRGEMLGQPLEMLVPDRFRRSHPSLRVSFHKSPSTRPMGAGRDLFGLRKDGTEVPIEIGLSPFLAPEGTFVLATIVDITERKYAEELRLLTAREQRRRLDAEQDRDRALGASLLKSQFVATMSHELRTPLTTIIGMTELLGRSALDDRQTRYAEQINEAAEALLSIINSILDFSKIEAGKVELDEREFEIQAVVESAGSVLAPQIRQKALRLHTYVDPLIPPLLCGDADRLMQILLNLVGNAVKFTQRGSVVVRAVPVETSLRRAVIRFEVQDTGIGIADETLPRLFEPFVQADSSSSRKYGGTGLGLSICKRLVALMGGEIGVESEPGRGSLLWFSLPFKRPDAATSSRKVFGVFALIYSDDETFADIVARYLDAWGMTCRRIRAATEITTALETADAAGPPEWIAVVDADASDSVEVVAALAAAPEIGAAHVIVVGDDDRQMPKPLRQSDLFDRISNALGAAVRIESVPHESSTSNHGELRSSASILVAEDNAAIQELLGHQLQALGIAAKMVSDGAEAVAALRQGRFDAVLMDCQMPHLDGFEATRLIREEERQTGRHTPIIAMTANAFKEDREACLAAGMDDYVSKPLRMETLRAKLLRWLSVPAESKT
jgi:PAS domain S-box-containing protein